MSPPGIDLFFDRKSWWEGEVIILVLMRCAYGFCFSVFLRYSFFLTVLRIPSSMDDECVSYCKFYICENGSLEEKRGGGYLL